MCDEICLRVRSLPVFSWMCMAISSFRPNITSPMANRRRFWGGQIILASANAASTSNDHSGLRSTIGFAIPVSLTPASIAAGSRSTFFLFPPEAVTGPKLDRSAALVPPERCRWVVVEKPRGTHADGELDTPGLPGPVVLVRAAARSSAHACRAAAGACCCGCLDPGGTAVSSPSEGVGAGTSSMSLLATS